MIVLKADGGRRIELFVPFEFLGVKVDSVTIAPLMLDHVLRWQKGAWQDSFDLLVEMTGMKAETLRRLRYPDADRVLTTFFEMLPPEIQSGIQRGDIPQRPAETDVGEEDGPGFDLGERGVTVSAPPAAPPPIGDENG